MKIQYVLELFVLKNKYNDNKLLYSDEDFTIVKKNIYCGFIQNTKLLFEFVFKKNIK